MSTVALKREQTIQTCIPTVLPLTEVEILEPTSEINCIQAQIKSLRECKPFLHQVFTHIVVAIQQYRLVLLHESVEGVPESSRGVSKGAIARIEKQFKAVLKQDLFWQQTTTWILARLESWTTCDQIPADCSIPDLQPLEMTTSLFNYPLEQEAIVLSARAFHTAREWVKYLDLPGSSVEDIEKLLGIRPATTFVADAALFQGREIERVATGYPILTGAQALISNQWEDGEYPYWRKLVGEGFIQHNIMRQTASNQQIELVPGKAAWEIIQQFGPEAAYVLLLFSSYATDSEQPWEQQIRLKGTDLIKLFGWDRRTDITLGQKLKKIGRLVELVCSLSVLINNINVGANRYNIAKGAMWLLEELEYVGQLSLTIDAEQPDRLRYEPGDPDELYIKVRPGSWTEKFLNARDLNGGREALCQYGYLAKSTLQINPYRQRLASKLAIFLTIMSRIRRDGRYEVGTLLERLEPKELTTGIQHSKQRRNGLIAQWDNALLTLHDLGWQIEFDPETYPESIRPDWTRLDQPDQPRTRPRNWLALWLKAIVIIKPIGTIQEKLNMVRSALPSRRESLSLSHKELSAYRHGHELTIPADGLTERPKVMTAAGLATALETKGMSKAQLAKELGVDRSLITRWIKGDRTIQPKHQTKIQSLLGC